MDHFTAPPRWSSSMIKLITLALLPATASPESTPQSAGSPTADGTGQVRAAVGVEGVARDSADYRGLDLIRASVKHVLDRSGLRSQGYFTRDEVVRKAFDDANQVLEQSG